MSRAIRAMLFVLLALVAGNDFLLQPYLTLDQDGVAAKHRPAPILSANLGDDGDEHRQPVPGGGGLGGALIVLLALVLRRPDVGAARLPPPARPQWLSAHVRVPEPRGPPSQVAWA